MLLKAVLDTIHCWGCNTEATTARVAGKLGMARPLKVPFKRKGASTVGVNTAATALVLTMDETVNGSDTLRDGTVSDSLSSLSISPTDSLHNGS